MRRPQRQFRAAGLLLAGIVVAVIGWQARGPAPDKAVVGAAMAGASLPAAVQVAPAVDSVLAPTVSVPGSVESRQDARIASEVGGRVAWVAEPGSHVAGGEVLARVDDEALRLLAIQHEAALSRIETSLGLARRQAGRLAAVAESSQSSISAAQLDQVRAERDTLAQDRRIAEATLAETRRRIAAATIRAPFAGVVVERFAQPGEHLAAGAPVLRLLDTDRLEVLASAPLEIAAMLREGSTVQLVAGAHTVDGQVRAVVPVGEGAARQTAVRIDLDASPWLAGAAVSVLLPQAPARTAVLAPRDAVVSRGQDRYVFRVRDARAERIAVRLGPAQGEAIEVSAPIQAGDLLVVRGAERLVDGQMVVVADQSRG